MARSTFGQLPLQSVILSYPQHPRSITGFQLDFFPPKNGMIREANVALVIFGDDHAVIGQKYASLGPGKAFHSICVRRSVLIPEARKVIYSAPPCSLKSIIQGDAR